MCPSENEAGIKNKGSPLQIALKPIYTQRVNMMGPKAPNMGFFKMGVAHIVEVQCTLDRNTEMF